MKKRKKTKEPDNVISPEEVDGLIPTLLAVEAWAASFRGLVDRMVDQGYDIPRATKVMSTTNRRVWDPEVDPQALILGIRASLKENDKPSSTDDAAPRSVLSPAQTESLLGKRVFSESRISGRVKRLTSTSEKLVLRN